MYLLILIIINSSGSSTSITTSEFKTSVSCLKALSSVLEMENHSLKIKARCVEK